MTGDRKTPCDHSHLLCSSAGAYLADVDGYFDVSFVVEQFSPAGDGSAVLFYVADASGSAPSVSSAGLEFDEGRYHVALIDDSSTGRGGTKHSTGTFRLRRVGDQLQLTTEAGGPSASAPAPAGPLRIGVAVRAPMKGQKGKEVSVRIAEFAVASGPAVLQPDTFDCDTLR